MQLDLIKKIIQIIIIYNNKLEDNSPRSVYGDGYYWFKTTLQTIVLQDPSWSVSPPPLYTLLNNFCNLIKDQIPVVIC